MRIIWKTGLVFVLAILMAGCSLVEEKAVKLMDHLDAETAILDYLDATNPIIEESYDIEVAAESGFWNEEDDAKALAFITENTIPALEKVLQDSKEVTVDWEQLQPSHDALILSNEKLLESYVIFAEDMKKGNYEMSEAATVAYDLSVEEYEKHERLFAELAEEYKVEVYLEEEKE
ncbi:hypothetical protein LC085_10045 [Bacillus tianshenii]|uniref:hypothetical protein n=1 Tax=Sutcliffiella tianshenii TaxID=1463404 RepID=UPI001CD4030D|nr:hypothetical protein [Bacillus tianshenii]MCA1320247.1 hypothetical protein [Bacillus tianshenii]